MRFVRPLAKGALLPGAMLLAVFLSAPARGQVLDQVPGDALVVVKVKNLDAVGKKVASFAKGLGLDQQEPKLADPVTALAEETHLTKGVNRGGDVAFAFVDPAGAGGDPEKSFLLLVPATDYKQFLGNFKATADAGNGVTKATPQDGPEDVFVASWGAYAAMSPNQAILAKKPTGIKLTGFSAKESAAKDVLLYANIKALRGKALPELKANRDKVGAEIEQALGQNGAKFVPLAKAVAHQFLNVAEEFLTDAHSATLALNLTDAGIGATVAADFDPTTYIGKLALQAKPTTGSMLAGLPDRKYFLFAGGTSDPTVTGKLAADLLDPIVKELAAVPETAKFSGALDSMKKAYGATTGFTIGYVAPTGALGQESVLQQVAVVRGDAKTIQKSQQDVLAATNDLMKLLPKAPGAAGNAVDFQYKPGGKTVAGVTFDAFETKMNFSDDDPQQQQAKQMLALVYGPNGTAGVLGAVDTKTVLGVQGGDEKLITDSVTAAKANADTLGTGAGVRMVRDELPKARTTEAYFDLATLLSTAVRYAKGFGAPVNAKISNDLPPIGFAAGTDATAVRFDVVVPTKLVQGLYASFLDAQKQMANPNGAGGGLQ